jgi:creatinine amidohydrolase
LLDGPDFNQKEVTTMRWEELTGDLFPQAVEKTKGVCLLPLSCIERHAHHLPLGTDMFIGRELCDRAAALEPAIVFPDFIFTQILEARHYPGCIGMEPDLTIRLLDNTCREIARNGLKKVVLVNAHGGNDHLIHYFAQIQLASPRDYVVYVAEPDYDEEDEDSINAQWETTVDGHAGERETSAILAIHPDLVRKDALKPNGEGHPLERLKPLRDLGVDMGIWWYADHPSHYCGDGSFGSTEKGHRWLEARARSLAKTVRAIKEDKETQRLQDEFFSRI